MSVRGRILSSCCNEATAFVAEFEPSASDVVAGAALCAVARAASGGGLQGSWCQLRIFFVTENSNVIGILNSIFYIIFRFRNADVFRRNPTFPF